MPSAFSYQPEKLLNADSRPLQVTEQCTGFPVMRQVLIVLVLIRKSSQRRIMSPLGGFAAIKQSNSAKAFIFGNERRIIERLLKLAQPIEHIFIVQICALSVNNALGILVITQARRDELIDHQVLRATHPNRQARLHFHIAPALNGKNIIRRVGQQDVQPRPHCVLHKHHSLSSQCLARIRK